MVDFEEMDVPSAYNLVVDKQLLNSLIATFFTYNLWMQHMADNGSLRMIVDN